MKLCCVSSILGGIHSIIRRTGKGESVQWNSTQTPEGFPNAHLDKMITLYDDRHSNTTGLHPGTQALDFTPFFGRLREPSALSSLALVVSEVPGGESDIPYWCGPVAKPTRKGIFQGRFLPGAVTTSRISDILALTDIQPVQWPDDRAVALVLFLRSLLVITYQVGWGPEWNPLPSVGYLVFPTGSLPELVDDLIPSTTADMSALIPDGDAFTGSEIVQKILDIPSCAWPLIRGPILRPVGGQTAIDIQAATYRLEQLFTIPGAGGGDLANARAFHFEDYVQESIDETEWRPPPKFRRLKRQTLRTAGRALTDIDAVAVHGSFLLLVSCKSVEYSDAYERGDYSVIRNARTMLEAADRDWSALLEYLRLNPRGDNFDVTGYSLVGVVCTPFVLFVHEPQTRPVLSIQGRELRAVCSIAELSGILHLPGDPA
jgi:hypothetical protein